MWPILLLPECGNAPYDNSGNKTLTGLFKFPSKDKKPQEYQSWVEAIRSWRWSKVVETRLTHLAKIQLYVNTRSSLTRCSVKRVFLEISQNSQENAGARVSFLIKFFSLRPATLLKKRLWHRRFPMNIVKFLRTLFLTEHLW